MTGRGICLALIRLIVLFVLVFSLLTLEAGRLGPAVVLAAAAVLIYAFAPRPALPNGAMTYHRLSAVILPDWMGLILTSLMLVLPVWAGPSQGVPTLLHPMAWLLWPMAAVFASFSVIAWRRDCVFLCLDDAGLTLDTGWRHLSIPWSQITRVSLWRRGLPRWMRRLVPLLVASGNPGPAGAILLARDSHGMVIERATAPGVILPLGGFEAHLRALASAFQARAIPVAPGALPGTRPSPEPDPDPETNPKPDRPQEPAQ